ncbi:MAG: hypothetical protein OXD01_15780 [Gammaproteobacteria bacterium]|nr:hypothetical protein [Gammaproteobacteria bacterium]
MSANKLDKPAPIADLLATADAERIAQQIAPPARNKPSPLMWLGLGGLAIVALLVIFVLPSIVSEYELPLERRDALINPVLPESSQPQSAISPFEEAQRSQQRKEAQDVLAELLEHQAELDALEVNAWGQDAYTEALAEATIGDDFYRTQQYLQAKESYQRGRDALAQLLATVPEALQRLLNEAQQALATSDAEAARQQFALVLVLDSDNEVARIGLQRAGVLEDVLTLLTEADGLVDAGQLEAARDRYQEVLDLDSYNEVVPGKLAAVQKQLTEIDFARIMSKGYAYLEAEDPERAIASFQRAAGLGINQAEAEAAIVQTETAVANARINALRQEIEIAETSEHWAEAVAAYDGVIAIDSNLSFANDGRVYANQRANLDAFLVHAIDNPERLAEDQVFEQTRGYYFTARDIPAPGPRLQNQLDELEQLLLNAQIPEEIVLMSDNLTDVTLLRVGQLGLFQQQTLSLKPGRYVAVGKRIGYRDVRQEFVVGFGQTPAAIEVRCVERVVASSGQ